MKIKLNCDICSLLHQMSDKSGTANQFLQTIMLLMTVVMIGAVFMGMYYYIEKKRR